MVRLGLCDLIGSNASGGNRWACIRVHLDWLQTELKALHREFHNRLQDHTAWVDLVMAAVLIAELPELNCLNGRELAALDGVVPLNNDRDRYRGSRRVWGVRVPVRTILYMVTDDRLPLQPRHPRLPYLIVSAGQAQEGDARRSHPHKLLLTLR